MKLLSWNVNGIRAAGRSGFLDWFEQQQADIVCVQEIKAFQGQVEPALRNPGNYHGYWHSAQKPGYGGVAIFSRKEPLSVTEGLGHEDIDREGRVIQADFGDFVVINAYFPNSQRDHARLGYKLQFCERMAAHCESLRKAGRI
jgi:exodeoxyribonuclease-3